MATQRHTLTTLLFISALSAVALGFAAPAQAQMGGQLSGRPTPPPAAGHLDDGDADHPAHDPLDASADEAPDQLQGEPPQGEHLQDDEPGPEEGATAAKPDNPWARTAEPVVGHTARVLAGTALGAAAAVLIMGVAQIGFLASSIGSAVLPLHSTAGISTLLGAGFFLIALATPVAVGAGAAIGAFLAGGKLWWVTPLAGVLAAGAALPVGAFLGAAAGLAAGIQVERMQGGIQTGFIAIFFAISAMPIGALLLSGLVGSLAATAASSAELLTPMFYKDVTYRE